MSRHEYWGVQTLLGVAKFARVGEIMGQVKSVTDSEFDSAINGDEWVLVDFWAPWCGPCKALTPILEQIAEETPVTVAKVNTDTDSMNAAKLGVRGIPALFLFHNGNQVANQVGMVPKPVLVNWLNENMNS